MNTPTRAGLLSILLVTSALFIAELNTVSADAPIRTADISCTCATGAAQTCFSFFIEYKDWVVSNGNFVSSCDASNAYSVSSQAIGFMSAGNMDSASGKVLFSNTQFSIDTPGNTLFIQPPYPWNKLDDTYYSQVLFGQDATSPYGYGYNTGVSCLRARGVVGTLHFSGISTLSYSPIQIGGIMVAGVSNGQSSAPSGTTAYNYSCY